MKGAGWEKMPKRTKKRFIWDVFKTKGKGKNISATHLRWQHNKGK